MEIKRNKTKQSKRNKTTPPPHHTTYCAEVGAWGPLAAVVLRLGQR